VFFSLLPFQRDAKINVLDLGLGTGETAWTFLLNLLTFSNFQSGWDASSRASIDYLLGGISAKAHQGLSAA